MKKRNITAALVLFCLSFSAFADIAENFAPTSVMLSGSGSFYWNHGRVADPNSKYDYKRVNLYINTSIFAARNLDLGIDGGLAFTNNTPYDGSYVQNGIDFNVGVFANYYFHKPSSKSKLVPSVGLGWGFVFDPAELRVTPSGTESKTWAYINMTVTPKVTLYYFVNDRFAPYIRLQGRLFTPIHKIDSLGNVREINFAENIEFNWGIYLGVSFFIPSSKRDL